jgi:hypothetical protein
VERKMKRQMKREKAAMTRMMTIRTRATWTSA